MLYGLTVVLFVLVCVLLSVVVLLQQGKGGDIAAAFGGSSSQTAFGARSGATVLTRATTILGVLFMVGAIALGVMARSGGASVVSGIGGPAVPTSPTGPVLPTGAAQTPTNGPVPGTTPPADGKSDAGDQDKQDKKDATKPADGKDAAAKDAAKDVKKDAPVKK